MGVAFDPVWESIHKSKRWGAYPSEHLVRWVSRKYSGNPAKFLDLGSGAGASAWFLRREGHWVVPVDGSSSAIKRIGDGVVADALQLPFKDASFDCVVDIVCIAHNSHAHAHAIIKEVARVLKPEGTLFSVMPTVYCSRAPYEGKGAVVFRGLLEAEQLFEPQFTTYVDRSWHTDRGLMLDHWIINAKKVKQGVYHG